MQRLAVDTLALCLDFLTFTEQLECRLLLRDVDAALATRISERMVEQYFRSMPSKSIAEGCPLVLRHTRFSNEERLARFLTIVKARRPPNLDVLLRMAVANSVVASQRLAERRHLVASMPRTSRLADIFLSWLSDDPPHIGAEVDGFRAVLGRDALAMWTQAIGSAPSAADARRDDDGSWMIDALEYFTAGSIIVYNHPALEAALGDVMLHFAPMATLSNEVNVDPDVACVATQLRDLMPNEFAVTSRGSLNFEMPQDFFVAPPVEAEVEQPTFRISKKGRKIPLPPPPPPVDSMVTNWAAARMAQAVGTEANALSAVCAVVAAHHVVVSRNAPKALAHCSTARSMRSLGFAPGCESLTFADVVGHCDGLHFLDLRVATAPQAVHGTALHDLSDLIVLPPQECIQQSQDFSPYPLSFIDSLDRLGYASRRLESVDLRALDGCLSALGIACFSACRQLTFVALPDSVTTIGDEFCCDCPKLKTLMLPRGLQSVGNHFVCACNALESVPSFAHCAELQYVGRKAFQGCRFLSYLILPESLTSIGAGFVDGCARLRAISIPPSLVALPEDFAFNCKLLSQVEFRDPHQSALVELQSRALCGCWALKEIHLPDTVRHLASCLNDCEQLVRIGLPASLQTISGKVLRNCANLVEINWDHVARADGPVAALDVAACLCENSNRAPSPPSNFMLRRTVGEQRRAIGTRLADLLEGDDVSPNSDDGSSSTDE